MLFQGVLYLWQQRPVQFDGSLVLHKEIQAAVDSLKRRREAEAKKKVNFNPNFLSDFQGYRLGLTPAVLDTIRSFRSAGGYFSSMEQFRQVAGLADSTIERIRPMLRFPQASKKQDRRITYRREIKDLNAASTIDLQRISGIGPVLSERIIRFRMALGGFLVDEQLYDVYGLDSAVVERLQQRYRVLQPPPVEQIEINSATADELAANVYITWDMAREIIAVRDRIKGFRSWEDLEHVEAIPKHRIARFRLYLSLEKKLHE